jgi:adenosylmethionine-8-amino-7-oxononanoate aminotransferase
LARQYQVEIGQGKRYKVLSRHQSYHGSTPGLLAVSGNRRRREIYLPMVKEFVHVGAPYCYRCAYGCQDCGWQYVAEVERAIEKLGGRGGGVYF